MFGCFVFEIGCFVFEFRCFVFEFGCFVFEFSGASCFVLRSSFSSASFSTVPSSLAAKSFARSLLKRLDDFFTFWCLSCTSKRTRRIFTFFVGRRDKDLKTLNALEEININPGIKLSKRAADVCIAYVT